MSQRISKTEFITLIGVMFAMIAFSTDAMLPALPEIGAQLTPSDPNQAQLVVTFFIIGLGLGTFVTGPLSDAFGRKPVIFAGALIFAVGALLSWISPSLELLLASRIFQGLGVAAPRVVGLAIVRDLYSGHEMARIVSIAMLIFTLFPAFAPTIGAGIIAVSNWRGIFLAFVVLSVVVILWMGLRLQEPLPRDKRRPFRLPLLIAAAKEIFAHPTVRISICVQTLVFSALLTMLIMVQPIYDSIYDRAHSFHFWFGAVALMAGTANIFNAMVVVRLGMRRMVTWALASQIVLSGIMLLLSAQPLPEPFGFACFVAWQTSLFFMIGITLGNLNAMAMEPMGHIAGMAASVIGGVSTVLAAAIASPIGLLFNSTLVPITTGVFVLTCTGFVLMLRLGRLERHQMIA